MKSHGGYNCQLHTGQAEGVGEGEAGSPLSREQDLGSIKGPWDHDLSRRQMPNPLSHPGAHPVLKHKPYKCEHLLSISILKNLEIKRIAKIFQET